MLNVIGDVKCAFLCALSLTCSELSKKCLSAHTAGWLSHPDDLGISNTANCKEFLLACRLPWLPTVLTIPLHVCGSFPLVLLLGLRSSLYLGFASLHSQLSLSLDRWLDWKRLERTQTGGLTLQDLVSVPWSLAEPGDVQLCWGLRPGCFRHPQSHSLQGNADIVTLSPLSPVSLGQRQ